MYGEVVAQTPTDYMGQEDDMSDHAVRADANYARNRANAASMVREWSWEDAFNTPVVVDLDAAREKSDTYTGGK